MDPVFGKSFVIYADKPLTAAGCRTGRGGAPRAEQALPPADGARSLPELPGILTGDQVRTTVAWIAGEQAADGALPWFRGGQLDPWDSVEAAMALDIGGEHDRAAAAYRWLAARQRPDGSWASEYRDGTEVSARRGEQPRRLPRRRGCGTGG